MYYHWHINISYKVKDMTREHEIVILVQQKIDLVFYDFVMYRPTQTHAKETNMPRRKAEGIYNPFSVYTMFDDNYKTKHTHIQSMTNSLINTQTRTQLLHIALLHNSVLPHCYDHHCPGIIKSNSVFRSANMSSILASNSSGSSSLLLNKVISQLKPTTKSS